jgi:hypothetical protein
MIKRLVFTSSIIFVAVSLMACSSATTDEPTSQTQAEQLATSPENTRVAEPLQEVGLRKEATARPVEKINDSTSIEQSPVTAPAGGEQVETANANGACYGAGSCSSIIVQSICEDLGCSWYSFTHRL